MTVFRHKMDKINREKARNGVCGQKAIRSRRHQGQGLNHWVWVRVVDATSRCKLKMKGHRLSLGRAGSCCRSAIQNHWRFWKGMWRRRSGLLPSKGGSKCDWFKFKAGKRIPGSSILMNMSGGSKGCVSKQMSAKGKQRREREGQTPPRTSDVYSRKSGANLSADGGIRPLVYLWQSMSTNRSLRTASFDFGAGCVSSWMSSTNSDNYPLCSLPRSKWSR